MGMDINASITKLTNEEIDKLGIKLPALAENTGIPYTTLSRKLKGASAWTATEIARIAEALRIPASRLFPAEFMQMADAA